MKRWPPFGASDDTPWQNGNPATGQRGSIIDARAIDHSQSEIVNAIIRLGLTPDPNNLQQLGQAIENAIAAATGGGDTAQFVTMATARARLQIFPEVLTADGKLAISSPSSGSLFVAASGAIRHRGIFDVEMSGIDEIDRTFPMLASKVAHLRWSPSGGLERFYLDDPSYNPGGLPETDPSFDSTYDDALLARAVTDSSANVTVTRLVNLARLVSYQEQDNIAGTVITTGSGSDGSRVEHVFTLDMARTPLFFPGGHAGAQTRVLNGYANDIRVMSQSRYGATVQITSDYDGPITGPSGRATLHAVAV